MGSNGSKVIPRSQSETLQSENTYIPCRRSLSESSVRTFFDTSIKIPVEVLNNWVYSDKYISSVNTLTAVSNSLYIIHNSCNVVDDLELSDKVFTLYLESENIRKKMENHRDILERFRYKIKNILKDVASHESNYERNNYQEEN